MDIALRFKMNAIVYLHHQGQFKSPDGDTKVKAEFGKMLFMDTRHDVSDLIIIFSNHFLKSIFLIPRLP